MHLSRFIVLLGFTVLCFGHGISCLAQTPYDTIGKASFYAKEFNGRKTANGEIFSNAKYTCAHPTLPFGTKLKVTNKANGKSCMVTVNDRGPYAKGRIIDLSKKAASDLDFIHQGVATVLVEEITADNECRLTHNHDTLTPKKFPADWQGHWCGVMEVFNAGGKATQVAMQFNVEPTPDSTRWQWQIIYDTSSRDYELVIGTDSTGFTYSIDERNGIVLPARLMGNTLVSTFDVQGNRIDAMYLLEDDLLRVTILSVAGTDFRLTGQGTDASPQVHAFVPTALQTAVLTRRK